MWKPIPAFRYFPFRHHFVEPSVAATPHPCRSQRIRKASTPELAQRLAEIIQEFASRCPKEEPARCYFLSEISRATGVLEGMVRLHSELWKPLARRSVQWPVLGSLNPGLSLASQQERLLGSLELGRDAFLLMTRSSRTSTENAATRYALSILMTLRDNRDSWAKVLIQFPGPSVPQWVRDAQALPPFNKRTSEQWWSVGKQAFLETVPYPEKIEELGNLARMKQTAAEKRALILERIGRVVKSLAPLRA